MKVFCRLHGMLVLFVAGVLVLSCAVMGGLYHVLSIWGVPMGWALGGAFAGGILLGMGVAMVVAYRTLKPMSDLVQATHSVARGDFTVRVRETRGKNDLALLLRSFNHMAEELGGIELLRSDFINNFSHEFKTPLATILGFARQLEKGGLPQEEQRDCAGIIAREAARLGNMASDVLLLGKVESQRILVERSFSLDEQLRTVLVEMEPSWSEKNLNLEIDLDPVSYRGNEELLQHVWRNLLDNAIKFSKPGGAVYVSLWQDAAHVVVDIGDTGIGMDGMVKRRVFEKFYQADPSHTTLGNGLGLPLVKRVVELSGGRIEVESEPGKGSLFSIRLPKDRE